MANIPWLTLLTISPLLGVIVLAFIQKDRAKAIKIIGIITTIIPVLIAGYLYVAYNPVATELQFNESYPWIYIPLNEYLNSNIVAEGITFDFSLAADGLSIPLVLLTAVVTLLAAMASVHVKKRWKSFYILLLLLEVGMFGVFLARDLFLFFLFFEITLVPMFFLIGIWGYMNREQAANRFLIYNGVGSAIMLIAFLALIYMFGVVPQIDEAGTLHLAYTGNIDVIQSNLTDAQSPYNDPNNVLAGLFSRFLDFKIMLFVMLLIAFGIKLPIFPFHTWMLKVHVEAPPSIVMIHSGILLKMGAYGLFRFGVGFFPGVASDWAVVLAALGVINILYGAVLAFVQKDMKLVLAYSSISHMGIVLLGLAAFNVLGYQGAYYQLISHGFISALMFLWIGSLYERTGSSQIRELGGLAKSIPFMSGVVLTAGMASLGLPLLSGFVSEFLTFVGLFQTMPVMTVLGALGIILSAAYVLRAVMAATFGERPERWADMEDARPIEAFPMIVLLSFIILLGVYPSILTDTIQPTIQTLVERIGG